MAKAMQPGRRWPSLPALLVLGQLPAVILLFEVGWALLRSGRVPPVLLLASAALAALGIAAGLLFYRSMSLRADRLADYAERLARGRVEGSLPMAARDALGRLEAALGAVGHDILERTRVLGVDMARQRREAELQRAFALTEGEPAALDVAARSVAQVAPQLPAEILLADMPEGPLRRVGVAPGAPAPGCPAAGLGDCLAIEAGHSLRLQSAADAGSGGCRLLFGRPQGPCSAACVPVRVAGSVVGVIHATAPIGQPPGDDVLAGLESVAAHLGGRLGMFDALERFEIAATTDPLTGLLNRRGFDERAREALRRQAAAAIVMCDLDQFKRLNDEKGHDAGDRALCLFAEVLRQGLRPSDLVARLGGEEFALVLPGCTADQAGRALARVAQTLAAELEKAAVPPFTASFGVASFPTQGEKLEDLLRLADTALYQSKREGRNRITLCERRSRPPTLTLLKP